MSDDITAAVILETQLREARAEAAGYRAHNEALQLQVAELNGELAAAEAQIVALRAMVDEGIDAVRELKAVLASHSELVATCDELLGVIRDTGLDQSWTVATANARAAIANARKVAP
jgi:chromosome segregation ATPase